ncbi:hypothetical protein ACFLQ1_00355 [Candidatus Auribacterota bacterium]
MRGKSFKRRQFLINKKFQLYYVGVVFLFFVLVSGSILFSFYYGFKGVIYNEFSWRKILTKLQTIDRIAGYEEMRQRYHDGPKTDQDIDKYKMAKEASMLSKNQEELFNHFLRQIIKEVALYLSILLLAILLGTIFLTHKIAGPLYRILTSLDRIQAGDLSARFHLRDGDKLQGLANSLDTLFSNYKSGIKDLIGVADELKKNCTVLEQKTSDPVVKEEIFSIQNKIKSIINICHRFFSKIS